MNIRIHLITEPSMKIPSQNVYIDDLHCILEGPDIVILIEDKKFINHWKNVVKVIGYQFYFDDIIVVNESLEEDMKPSVKHSDSFILTDIKVHLQLAPKVKK